MFDFLKRNQEEVTNPLKVGCDSAIEFKVGPLAGQGLYKFKKIIQFEVGGKLYARYLINSLSDEDAEYVFEAFPGGNGSLETFLMTMEDTIPFSEDFLEVVGQPFISTPNGREYKRCIITDSEQRIEGLEGNITIYGMGNKEIEKKTKVTIWDYQRDVDGRPEYLNVELSQENGVFRIFIGEMIEDIFYKVYKASE